MFAADRAAENVAAAELTLDDFIACPALLRSKIFRTPLRRLSRLTCLSLEEEQAARGARGRVRFIQGVTLGAVHLAGYFANARPSRDMPAEAPLYVESQVQIAPAEGRSQVRARHVLIDVRSVVVRHQDLEVVPADRTFESDRPPVVGVYG